MFFISLIRNILNFIDHFQQKKIIKFFKDNSIKKIILFDVGSHYGETIKLFSKEFAIEQFHCFEASPINFDKLKKNIENLNFKNEYCLNNIGLSYDVGEGFINQTYETSSSTINDFNFDSKYLKRKLKILNIKNDKKFYKKIPIKISNLDNYINKKKINKIDILKIDTEGYEYNIIRGLSQNYKIIKFIYFEHHYDDMIKKNYKFSDINKILNNFGFKKVFKSRMYFRKSFEYIYKNKFI
jgi:FkbM family methyltransferase